MADRLRIAVGADHGGFALKEHLKAWLAQRGHAVEDCGTHSTESVDYPVFAQAVARKVASQQADVGIVVDGAGIGSAMAANKIDGVRAAACYDVSTARNSREHNNANVLTLGAGLIGQNLATQIVDVWLGAACEEDRHLRRAAMIDAGPGAGSAACCDSCSDGGTCECQPAASGASAAAAHSGDAGVSTLDDSDIQRIVQRVAELANEPGGLCADLACAFCKVCAEVNPELVRQLVDLGADRIGQTAAPADVPAEMAQYIDHTLLKPEATADQVRKLCAEALQYKFASVCVNPTYVSLAAQALRGSNVRTCAVVGFPLGTHTSQVKALEARQAIREGAREIDMVINVGALKSGDDDGVYRDIRAVTETCIDGRAICKVIIETALLNDDEKVRACLAAKRARADFVKTSTGFGPSGATAHDVALMAGAVHGTGIEVKASGGIRSAADAREMIQAGATRLGVSAGVKIVKEARGLTVSGETANGSGQY